MKFINLIAIAALPLIAGCATYSGQSAETANLDTAVQGVAPEKIYPALRKPALSQHGVSSADPRASRAGDTILAQGGSATDAAIAVMLALTVVEPQSSGIGGGGFMIRASSLNDVTSFDGRETAPATATGTRFLDGEGNRLPNAQRVTSGLSVGVPGNVAMVAKAHAQYGKLPWKDLFEPAIALAEDGFLMNRRLNKSLNGRKGRADLTEAARQVYFGANGDALPVGTLIRVPELAKTLRMIAQNGPQAMYQGEAASALASYVATKTPQDGKMAVADVTSYQAKQRDAVCGKYRSYTICGMGPPSSGGIAVIQMLGQLERFDLAALGPDSPQFWHLFLESQRVAYADRALYTGDADFVSIPVAGLIDPEYIAQRSQLIDPEKRNTSIVAGRPKGAPTDLAIGDIPGENGTSHFSVVDAAGNAVSYTSTIEGAFGSGLFFGGYYLNNELTDFSATPVKDGKPVNNRVQGGKRPRSSMSPTIVFDPQGEVFMVVGAAGGPTIPVQTTRSIIGVIDFGLTANQALALPFIMGFGEAVIVEKGKATEAIQDAFKAMGHAQIRATAPPLKSNALLRTDKGWESADDPRIAPNLATQ